MEHFDVIIIGGGPAGLGLAYPLKQHGLKVAVVEENLWGGTCPNRGCDPKKLLLAGIEAKQHAADLVGNGIVQTPAIDWHELMLHKRSYTDGIPSGSENGLVNADITTIEGHAQFIDRHTLQVGEQNYMSDRMVIATGQRPVRLAIPGSEYLETSTDFLKMDPLPKRIAFIGGGYVAFELAAIAAGAGSEVHLIHHNDRPLKAFPAEGVKDLVERLKQLGVIFHFNESIQQIIKKEQKLQLIGTETITVDRVFGATGRRANDDTLNLDQIGIKTTRGGIQVNDHLQTSVGNIYAMGDVIDKQVPKLTPVAGFEARYLLQELLQTGAAIKYPVISTIVYGPSRLAQVGISVAAAQKNSDLYQITQLDMTGWYTYLRVKDPMAKAEIIHEKATGKIVGGYFISARAEEMANYLTMIIQQQLTMADIQSTIFGYPTEASDLQYL